LLTRRPDVEAAERRLAAAIQDVREARAEELPRVTLTGDIGHASESFDRFANYSSHEATIMPVISLPLFEGDAAGILMWNYDDFGGTANWRSRLLRLEPVRPASLSLSLLALSSGDCLHRWTDTRLTRGYELPPPGTVPKA
jgi:hypothetical protein